MERLDNWYFKENWKNSKFQDLCGRTILKIERFAGDLETLIFHVESWNSTENDIFIMRGNECDSSLESCEVEVYIEDITGDLSDLINSPILKASVEQNTIGEDNRVPSLNIDYLWTFYKLATIKGYVDIRWYGGSNGHYSIEVDFKRINHETYLEYRKYLLNTRNRVLGIWEIVGK